MTADDMLLAKARDIIALLNPYLRDTLRDWEPEAMVEIATVILKEVVIAERERCAKVATVVGVNEWRLGNKEQAMLRLNYDDAPNDVMDKVNAALKPYGVVFVDDGQEHDGFELYRLNVDASNVVTAERAKWKAALEAQSAADFCCCEGPLFDLAKEGK